MPDKDGIEVIMTLRHESPQLKVIAISGGGALKDVDVLESAEALGAYATLKKPFELDDIIETVNRALAA